MTTPFDIETLKELALVDRSGRDSVHENTGGYRFKLSIDGKDFEVRIALMYETETRGRDPEGYRIERTVERWSVQVYGSFTYGEGRGTRTRDFRISLANRVGGGLTNGELDEQFRWHWLSVASVDKFMPENALNKWTAVPMLERTIGGGKSARKNPDYRVAMVEYLESIWPAMRRELLSVSSFRVATYYLFSLKHMNNIDYINREIEKHNRVVERMNNILDLGIWGPLETFPGGED